MYPQNLITHSIVLRAALARLNFLKKQFYLKSLNSDYKENYNYNHYF
jgi:hypothetical protein